MTEFIAFQQFLPIELKADDRCIWCGNQRPKNRAHVISRRLTNSAMNDVVLRFSVCTECNSQCGKLEQWILRRTPLSWIRLMAYIESNSDSDTKSVPSYFFTESLGHWVVFHLDALKLSYAIPAQLILGGLSESFLITDSPLDMHENELCIINTAVQKSLFRTEVMPSLPEDFAARFLLQGDCVTLIARDTNEAKTALDIAMDLRVVPDSRRRYQVENKGVERYHFQWSKKNWVRFCAKTAYEALCLFEGADCCLDPAYAIVRSFVLEGVSHSGRDLLFDKHGPVSNSDVPLPVHVDLSAGQNAPSNIQALIFSGQPRMHSVLLYELSGWIIASVSFSGFPPSILILAGPDSHLEDIYGLIYDDEQRKYDFVKLAYDPTSPIIPLPLVAGELCELRNTYGLTKAKQPPQED